MAVYQEHTPSRALRPFVETLWTSVPGGEPGDPRVLPDGCIDILFTERRDGQVTLEVIGTMTRWQLAPDAGAPRRVGVRFQPGAAARLLPSPVDAFTDQTAPLVGLWGDEGRRLLERMTAAARPAARLRVLDEALMARLARAPEGDAAVLRGIDRITGARAWTVPGLSGELGLSDRQFRRRFQAAVGIGPKRFARIARFRRVLAAARRANRVDWAGLAAEAGYTDQPHLIAEFRQLAGRTPGQQHGAGSA